VRAANKYFEDKQNGLEPPTQWLTDSQAQIKSLIYIKF